MAFSTVLLDLDGTITNPYMGITNGVMYAYEHLGLEVPPRESFNPKGSFAYFTQIVIL